MFELAAQSRARGLAMAGLAGTVAARLAAQAGDNKRIARLQGVEAQGFFHGGAFGWGGQGGRAAQKTTRPGSLRSPGLVG